MPTLVLVGAAVVGVAVTLYTGAAVAFVAAAVGCAVGAGLGAAVLSAIAYQ